MTAQPAARVGDPFGHTAALDGALAGLLIGALVGLAIIATGGLGAIAIGAALAATGGIGMVGQSIGSTIPGPPTGAIATGSPNVLTNGMFQALVVVSTGPCANESGVTVPEATGAASVFVNTQPAGRVSETMACSAVILSGSPNVFIGGPSVQVLPIEPEVPAWLSNTMMALAIGGTLIATAGVAAVYGIGAAVGSLVGGLGGSYAGSLGGAWAAAKLGFGATGQAIGSAIGGFIGGFVGGSVGFKALGNPARIAIARQPAAFQEEYAQAKAAGFRRENGDIWWPPNNGAAGTPEVVVLEEGAMIDRFGNTRGSFMGTPGDPIEARALSGPPTESLNEYVVAQPLRVEQAEIAPWFEQPGGGTQYKLIGPEGWEGKFTVQDALDLGYLKVKP